MIDSGGGVSRRRLLAGVIRGAGLVAVGGGLLGTTAACASKDAVPEVDSAAESNGVTLDNWQAPENVHWSFQHVAEFLPTAVISRGSGKVVTMNAVPRDLSDIDVEDPLGGPPSTVADVIAATDTDGWIVTHRGGVLVEQYYDEMTADSLHLLMSVSKSFTGILAGALVADGVLDVAAPLTRYVPALSTSGYAGATVRDVLDMRSGIAFSEDYDNPQSEVRLLEQAVGWAPRAVADLPNNLNDFLLTLRQSSPHGGPFSYRSSETCALGWVCEAAGEQPIPELMSELLWGKLGADLDATIGVDSVGTGLVDGGISASLRDLARFGSLFLTEGTSPTGRQVVAPSWIAETFSGASDSRAAYAASPDQGLWPGGMYRNQCWFPNEGNEVLLCLGVHGQMVYVNRAASLVAAKLSSWPVPVDITKMLSTVAAFDAIAAHVT